MMNATAVTLVFWDIVKCPVPPDFDARRVGPCIKRFLEKSGYSGPLTITAIGRLTDFPLELLRTLSSTGIFLHMTPDRPMCFQSAMFSWTDDYETPANIMVITDPTNRNCSCTLALLKGFGYNIILPYPFRPAECVWQNFLRAESGALEAEDKCIGTGESAWLCTECFTPSGQLGVTGQGFESFSTHISSQEHEESFCLPSEVIPKPAGSDEDYYDEDYEYKEAVGAWSENSLPGAQLCGYSRCPAYTTIPDTSNLVVMQEELRAANLKIVEMEKAQAEQAKAQQDQAKAQEKQAEELEYLKNMFFQQFPDLAPPTDPQTRNV